MGNRICFSQKPNPHDPKGSGTRDFRAKSNWFPQDIQSFIIFALIQCPRARILFLIRKRGKSIWPIYSKFYYFRVESVCAEMIPSLTLSTEKWFPFSCTKAEILLEYNESMQKTNHSKTESPLRGNAPIQCKGKSFLLWQDTSYRNRNRDPSSLKQSEKRSRPSLPSLLRGAKILGRPGTTGGPEYNIMSLWNKNCGLIRYSGIRWDL